MKYIALLLFACVGILLFLSFVSRKPPTNIGLENNQLTGCEGADNCVSSMAEEAANHVDPIPLAGPAKDALATLKKNIEEMGGVVAERNGNYLRAEFTSALWRFRDDLECLYEETAEVVQLRSASRVGYSDFGVNRKRVEELRNRLAAQ